MPVCLLKHPGTCVSHHPCDLPPRHALLRHPGRCSVPKRVRCDLSKFRARRSCSEAGFYRRDLTASPLDDVVGRAGLTRHPQRLEQGVVDRHLSAAFFRAGATRQPEVDPSLLQVDTLPGELKDRRRTRGCLKRQEHEEPDVGRLAAIDQPRCLRPGQPPLPRRRSRREGQLWRLHDQLLALGPDEGGPECLDLRPDRARRYTGCLALCLLRPAVVFLDRLRGVPHRSAPTVACAPT